MDVRELFNKWVILSAIAIALLLTFITILSAGLTAAPQESEVGLAPAHLTIIPVATSTSNVPATATIDPYAPTPVTIGVAINNYVQVTGTNGEGLFIRSEPGTDGEPVFLGYDSEVFIVRDGPQEADGYSWWYLVAPYDETRAGWAAADFLSYIPEP